MRYLAPMPPPDVSTPDRLLASPFRVIYRVCGGVHSTTRVLHRNSGRSSAPNTLKGQGPLRILENALTGIFSLFVQLFLPEKART